MDYRHQKNIQGDPLKLLYILGVKIFQLNFVKIILKLQFSFCSALIVAQIYFFLSKPTMAELMKYGPLFLQMSYATFTTFVLLDINKLVDAVMKSIRLWATNAAGRKMEAKIKNESKMMNMYAILNMLVSVLWATSMAYPYHNDIETFFTSVLFKKYFPSHRQLLGYIVRLTSYVACFTMLAHPFEVVYMMEEIKFQIYLFNKFVQDISEGFGKLKEASFYDDKYQKEIEFRLKVLTKRHCDFIRWRDHTLHLMRSLIVPFSFSAVVMALCVTFLVFQMTSDCPRIFIVREILLALCTGLAITNVITSGQALVDESNNIMGSFMLTNWYTWNCKNRRTMLLIITNTSRPINLKFTEAIAIDFQLGMAIGKIAYTAASVFYGML